MDSLFFEDRLTIRIPQFIYLLLQKDVAAFGFYKKNGKQNENAFYNHLFPNMILFRDYKKEKLRNFFEKVVKPHIPEKKQNIVISILTDSFDFQYFDESGEYECDANINWRISKENLDSIVDLFHKLDSFQIKRSTYLRGLINEYCNMPDFQRERVCFRKNYNDIKWAVDECYAIAFCYKDQNRSLYPLMLEYSHANNAGWYVVGVNKKDPYLLHSFLLREMTKVNVNDYNQLTGLPEHLLKKVEYIRQTGLFSSFITMRVEGGEENA